MGCSGQAIKEQLAKANCSPKKNRGKITMCLYYLRNIEFYSGGKREMVKGELVLMQREDGGLQYWDDLSKMWCHCGKPANNYFPEEDHWKFQCEKCAHGKE